MLRSLLEDTNLYLIQNHYEVVKEPNGSFEPIFFKLVVSFKSGDDRDRTGDLWLAKPPLSQLSYIPEVNLMGLSGVEPLTSRLSGARSNQLSYRPNYVIRSPVRRTNLYK